MIGIYKITNKLTNKSYIGESNDIERRWSEHKEELINNSHKNYKLQEDWNTYGENNFVFEILEEIDKLDSPYKTTMQLIYLEDKYIIKYNALNQGYNIENTLDEVINSTKIIMKQNLDQSYLICLISNNGIPKIVEKIETKNLKTVREYILSLTKNKYILNCSYPEVFQHLRNHGYYYLNENKTNVPYECFIDIYFKTEIITDYRNRKYTRVYLLEQGKIFLKNFLLENNLITLRK